ncbi:MAG: SDR family NAD(P)-dependent oxidoreductase [Candidatus Bathyarchaeia archaeon]
MQAVNKVLVAGGAGFIGSHLADRLVKDGFAVVVLDDFSTGKLENIKEHIGRENFSLVKSDVRDEKAVREALNGVEAVFHLAAITSVPFSVKYPRVTREINVKGTENLLEMCLKCDVEKFVYASSCAVYGEPKYLPLDEKHPTWPLSPYAESKLEAEGICRSFGEKYGLRTVVLRFFNVYGLRMRRDQYSGVISRFIERLSVEKPPVIYGDGEQTRDFIYVEDVVEAMMLALNKAEASGGTFNIGSGTPLTINRLAALLMEIMGVNGVKPVHRKARRGDIRHSYAEISLAETVLGFKPQTPIEEGLAKLAAK